MIDYITGKIIDSSLNAVTVQTKSGIGFHIFCPSSVVNEINDLYSDNIDCEPVSLHISTVISEKSICLYGFLNKQQKKLFETITAVSGIGPKIALEIISNMSVSDFISAVVTSNAKSLTGVKGIGKKCAEKIIFSLKDKLSQETVITKTKSQKYKDLLQALVYMGYTEDKAEKITEAVYDDTLSIEDLIKKALSS